MFLISFANILPRLASMAAFLCLVVAHLEWPLMAVPPFVLTRVPWRPGARPRRPPWGDAAVPTTARGATRNRVPRRRRALLPRPTSLGEERPPWWDGPGTAVT